MRQFLTAHDLTCHLTLVVYNQRSPHCSLKALSLCSRCRKKNPQGIPQLMRSCPSNFKWRTGVLGFRNGQTSGGKEKVHSTEPEALCFPGLSSKPSTAWSKKQEGPQEKASQASQALVFLTTQEQGTQDETGLLQLSQPFLTKHRQPRKELYSRSILWPCIVDRHFPVASNKLQDL